MNKDEEEVIMWSEDLVLKTKEVEKENPEVAAIIHEIEENQDIFLSHISHELRNVLTLMNSSLQFLEKTHPEIMMYKYWKEVNKDCQYMLSFINQMSDYNNSIKLNYKRVDLYKLLRETYQACLPLTENTEKVLTFRCQSDIPAIYADQTKLYEAFLNLIKNALEAVDDAGTVNVTLTTDEKTIRISIEDDGCGIEAEKLAHIFEPFVTYKPGGTGLGLSVVRRIVDAHEGRITVYSSIGKGTTMTITLPKVLQK